MAAVPRSSQGRAFWKCLKTPGGSNRWQRRGEDQCPRCYLTRADCSENQPPQQTQSDFRRAEAMAKQRRQGDWSEAQAARMPTPPKAPLSDSTARPYLHQARKERRA